MWQQVWQEWPMNEGFTQKVKSLRFKIKSLNQASSKSKTLIIQLSRSTTPSAPAAKTWQTWNRWSAPLRAIWWWRFGREVKSGSGERPWSLAEKALFSSISGHLTKKTLAQVFNHVMESDLPPAQEPWFLDLTVNPFLTMDRYTAASKSMVDFRVSRKRGKTLNVDYPTSLTRFFI